MFNSLLAGIIGLLCLAFIAQFAGSWFCGFLLIVACGPIAAIGTKMPSIGTALLFPPYISHRQPPNGFRFDAFHDGADGMFIAPIYILMPA